jgi:hypothetical protein
MLNMDENQMVKNNEGRFREFSISGRHSGLPLQELIE